MTVLLVVIGGGAGALLRYLLGALPGAADTTGLSVGHFMINIIGAFGLGALMTLLAARRLNASWAKPLLSTGLLGGFTTWSHFIVESDQ